MPRRSQKFYKTAEFASLAGVTVRALHHYDRLGLLKPSRTANCHRLYNGTDLAALQQIITLKFIGFSLKQIKGMLGKDSLDLAKALERQREIICEQRRNFELVIETIERVERTLAS